VIDTVALEGLLVDGVALRLFVFGLEPVTLKVLAMEGVAYDAEPVWLTLVVRDHKDLVGVGGFERENVGT
jgi:hypothetical protein